MSNDKVFDFSKTKKKGIRRRQQSKAVVGTSFFGYQRSEIGNMTNKILVAIDF